MNSNNGKALKLHFITIISNIFIHQRLSHSLDLHSVIASFCFCQSLPIWERTQKPPVEFSGKQSKVYIPFYNRKCVECVAFCFLIKHLQNQFSARKLPPLNHLDTI